MQQKLQNGSKAEAHLLTERPQVDAEGKAVPSCLFIPLTLGKIKTEAQQGHGEKWRELPQFSRLNTHKQGKDNVSVL